MQAICTSGSISAMWKRSHGQLRCSCLQPSHHISTLPARARQSTAFVDRNANGKTLTIRLPRGDSLPGGMTVCKAITGMRQLGTMRARWTDAGISHTQTGSRSNP
jgi:hypothetical protein